MLSLNGEKSGQNSGFVFSFKFAIINSGNTWALLRRSLFLENQKSRERDVDVTLGKSTERESENEKGT